MTYLLAALVAALGIAAVVYGEGDDSPGLQLIGGALVFGAIVMTVKNIRQRDR